MSESTGEPAPARPAKSAAAFRTIGEVADDLDLPAHVLRFWESKFPQLKPLKRGGGRRYYRPEDVVLLRRIRQCLYQDGYTIRGVQKLLGNGSAGPAMSEAAAAAAAVAAELSLLPFAASAPADPPDDGAANAPPAAPVPRRQRRQPSLQPPPPAGDRAALEDIRRDLQEARALLEELLHRGHR